LKLPSAKQQQQQQQQKLKRISFKMCYRSQNFFADLTSTIFQEANASFSKHFFDQKCLERTLIFAQATHPNKACAVGVLSSNNMSSQ